MTKISRAEWVARARALHAQGMLRREIAEALGLCPSFVSSLLTDPTAERERARKASYGGTCEGCGARTDGSNGRSGAPKLCFRCCCRAHATWDRERCIEAIRLYARMFGVQPGAGDFQPSLLAYHSLKRIRLAEERHAAGDWPSVDTVAKYCGSWSAAIRAAGFRPYDPTAPRRGGRT